MRSLLVNIRRSCVIAPHRKYGAPRGIEPPHMNELPSPCGPWQPWYAKKQSFYSTILFLGIGWFALSMFLSIYCGAMYLNWSPPAKPGPPSVEDDEDDSALPNLGLPPC